MDISYLTPKIRRILTGPDVDLSTISAKRVRKQLVAGGLDESVVRDRKGEIDGLIAQIFESISKNGVSSPEDVTVSPSNGGKPPGTPVNKAKAAVHKRKRSSSPEPSNYYEPPSSQPKPLAHKKSKQLNGSASGKQLSDAELARQLSLELNGRSTRAGAGPAPSGTTRGKAKATGKKGKRSKATIDSDGEDDNGEDRPKKSGGAKGGFGKEYMLSDALAQVTGHPQLSRPQAVKKLWEYIKGNNLQNPSDKREILCDENMKAVFNTQRLNMFTMNKILGDHLFELGE